MGWAALLALLRRRAPSLVEGFVGASDDDLAALAARIGRPLPASYDAFLRSVGRASPRFTPLGATRDHRLSAIHACLDQLEVEGATRWLPIAIETDPSELAPLDVYLDLSRADDEDPPLVEMESLETEAPPASRERLGARLTWAVLTGFELPRREVLDELVIGPTSGASWREVRAAISAVFGAPRLDAGGVAWWRDAGARDAGADDAGRCVLARSRDDAAWIALDLGGDDERAVDALADHLRARLAGARRPGRGPSPVFETALDRKRGRRK